MCSDKTLTLDSDLTHVDVARLLYSDGYWGNVRLLWAYSLRTKRPIRTNAARFGIDLPDCDGETWRREFKRCFVCGVVSHAMHVHHIERRGQVHSEREDRPENWMLACARCHAEDLATMPHAQQLAYKWCNDPCGHATLDTFLDRWLRIKDPELKAPKRVTVAEVDAWL